MLLAILQLFLVSFGLLYFVTLATAGLRVLAGARRNAAGTRLAGLTPLGQAAHRNPGRRALHRAAVADRPSAVRRLSVRVHRELTVPDEAGPRATAAGEADYRIYFIVPCLDEELVIEQTVQDLLTIRHCKVVVIDDASSDRTAEIAGSVDPARVIVQRRHLPDARQGKGPALNAGLIAVRADVRHSGLADDQVIVCVMDADGRLSRRADEAVLPLFNDPEVGGVQLAVRIRNRDDGLLPRMQDALFVGLSATFQLARVQSGTVSLGGNGQFTRLTALLTLKRDPWRRSLTEDLDVSVALSVQGWRITTTAAAYVDQQGVTTVRALFDQWTRWYQGHMECSRWIPRLWSSRKLSHLGMLEITLFLLVPWVLVLPWSVLSEYMFWLMIRRTADFYALGAMGTDVVEHSASLALWYVLSFSPNWIVGYLYHRMDRKTRFWRGIITGHLLLAANLVAYAAAWRALYRMLTRQQGWTKTSRSAEDLRDRRAPYGVVTARPAASPAPSPARRRMVIPGTVEAATAPAGISDGASTRPMLLVAVPAPRPPQEARPAATRPGSGQHRRRRAPAGAGR
jgi:1,2-diacylglycerol 3-beta-glucosyltransferase